MDEQLYRIHWKAKRTGCGGKGTRGFPLKVAQRLSDELNEQDKDFEIVHWIEPDPGIDDLVEDGHAS